MGTTSTSQSVQLTNNAANVLTVNSVLATGDFSQTNGCTTVAPGASCTITVTFQPSLTGIRYGSVIISDSAGVQVVLLAGTGNAPGVELSPASVNFGSAVVGASSVPQSITLTNNGSSSLTVASVTPSGDFIESDNCVSSSPIASGSSCTIQATFTPSATGTRQGALAVVDDAGTQVASLQGTGTAPGVTLSTSTLSFTGQTVGTSSAAQTATLTNSGTSGLTVTSFTTGGDFSVTSPDCAPPLLLAGGGICTLQVVFSPTAAGGRTGAVTILDGIGTHVIALSGTGAAVGVSLSPATLSFGTVDVAASSQLPVSIVLDAATAAPLQVTSVTASGDYTVISNCSSPVTPGSSCSVSVTFSPASTGARTGTVLLGYTIGEVSGQLVLPLNGTGIAPGVGLSSSTLGFGSQVVSTTSTAQSVTVTNSGTDTLTVASVVATGDFVATGDCVSASPLTPNGTCTVSVTFTPLAAGTRTGTVTITDSAGTQGIALSGVGNAPGVGLSSSTLSFGSQVVNTTSDPAPVTLTNTGDSDLAIASITAAGDFSETDTCNAPTVLAGGASCIINVSFSPTATGTRNGAITIIDSLGSHVIALNGTGNAPGVGLSPSSLTFGSQTVGTASPSQPVTLTNSGTSNLTIANVSASGDFSASGNCVSGIAPLARGQASARKRSPST